MSVERERARHVVELNAAADDVGALSQAELAALLRGAAERIEHDGRELRYLITGEEEDA